MKSVTRCKKIVTALLLAASPEIAAAQVTETNPDQYVIIKAGQAKINDNISEQTKKQQETAALQGSIAYQFTTIKKWEGNYNSYLKTAKGYAEALKAGMSLYADGVQTLRHIYEIKRAIQTNPAGVAATIAMDNLYLEATSEFIKVYSTIKESLDKGGKDNMLNGEERTEMLWELSDRLEDLNRRLRLIAVSIAYYNMNDVWNKYTAGLVDRDHATIASEAFDRWKKARRVSMIFNSDK